jgi:hypothetical protein
MVVKNLEETRQRLINEISLLSTDVLNEKPDPDTWSISQVCEHIALAEKSFAKAIRYGLKQEDNPKSEFKPIHVLYDRTKKVKAPEMVIPSDEKLDLQEILDLLSESRSFFLEILGNVSDTAALSKKTVAHPLFGDLLLQQWAELVPFHEDRHIEQIKEIKAKIL